MTTIILTDRENKLELRREREERSVEERDDLRKRERERLRE